MVDRQFVPCLRRRAGDANVDSVGTCATFLAPTSCRNGGLTRGSLVAVRPPSSRRPLSQGSRGRTTIFTDSSTANLTRTSSEAKKSPAGKKTLMGEREREHGKSIGLLASTQSLRSSPRPGLGVFTAKMAPQSGGAKRRREVALRSGAAKATPGRGAVFCSFFYPSYYLTSARCREAVPRYGAEAAPFFF